MKEKEKGKGEREKQTKGERKENRNKKSIKWKTRTERKYLNSDKKENLSDNSPLKDKKRQTIEESTSKRKWER